MKKIFIFICSVLCIILFAIFLLNYSYSRIQIKKSNINKNITDKMYVDKIYNTKDIKDDNLLESKKIQKSINILLLATDKSQYITDSILLVHYDFNAKSTSLISIPRDTKVDLSQEIQKELNIYNKYIKINELHSYAKMAKLETPISYTKKAVEEITGQKIDNVILFQIEAFKNLVDIIGGVEVYIPQDLKYSDPTQNLYINLKQGRQILNGSQAEGFLRFRKSNSLYVQDGYNDFCRTDIQQYFLKEFIKKLLSVENIINISEILNSVYKFINTDLSLPEMVKLFNEIKNIDMNKIYSHTLEGENKKIDNLWYYVLSDDIPQKIDLYYKVDRTEKKSSKDFIIVVQNSINDNKYAKKIVDDLKSNNINAIYGGKRKNEVIVKNKIFVPEEGYGIDIMNNYLSNSFSEIIVSKKEIINFIDNNSNLFSNEDSYKIAQNCIIIVLGRLE